LRRAELEADLDTQEDSENLSLPLKASGGNYFLRNNWTEQHLPNDVDSVHKQAMTSKQTDGIKFTDKDGNITTHDNDEDDGNT